MAVTEDNTGVYVVFQFKHRGHDFELGRVFLSKSERAAIAGKKPLLLCFIIHKEWLLSFQHPKYKAKLMPDHAMNLEHMLVRLRFMIST